ncbi:citrate (Si)-synthase [Ponticoccus sp. SC2-23]|uniref:citrate/2-methylcitrate synthase n=1 Tax=Alexandriicola marinus TaxID=2081710 RepID=UPI000FDA4008|nr:citrate/2-methylcitrate synthase [Alexandriicola marinus]MBM1222153.1 citrate (Si)-synthase [Ponticoccus sp. SC6-9]MBM1226840.1 citrate (Si)-synthase [Ponticoccus sp. SC6-15]MBM1231100.1 citrate (Si)-synthase [Ponticoccus sp. SC6-38]MBM1235648.1 citrate (Si)-synthase [Ponticoccus sp. SC6-45]MBM1240122.1 citrate (Si)-synthase [Ponticoccus sp. SC6-49]MBM1244476.1 citrate (Si)-synthase [Ponticoccus sp. SC2-64]MBM1249122.1 citrate (Si)-synthase [Ponticoccus sp. SC6-42]MBM1253777.1 citrate (S
MTDSVKINRGLKGVYFERSAVSHIDGAKGELSYRGYSIHDLATHASFEEVCYLLIHGELPGADDLARFDATLRANRAVPDEVIEVIRTCAAGHPMDVLRTAVSALAALDPASADASEEGFLANGLRLIAQVPTLIAAHEAIRTGRDPVAPDPALGHAANWLWMLKGQRPSDDAARLADVDFILHAEHGANASSFAARVTVGTEANLHGAIVTALSTLAGPAHGGAAEDVMKMVHEIGTPENAAAYVKAKRANREAVTGFGHRVYRAEDPRARHMREGVRKLGEEMGAPEWYEILQAVVEAMKPYARHGLNVNVDFYSGVIYQLHGIPMDLYVPIFAIGRMPGWVIQCLEQRRGNILIRPLTLYNGPEMRDWIPMDAR